MSQVIKGIAVSEGISTAKVFILKDADLSYEKSTVTDVDAEVSRLGKALNAAVLDLEKLRDKVKESMGADKAMIFDAHILVLQDPETTKMVNNLISDSNVNAEVAYMKVMNDAVAMFEAMDNEYMRERAADMKDVSKRVLAHLLGVQIKSPAEIDEEVIVIAYDLTPSDTAQLNRKYVKGFATNIGGRTSHSAIMAKSLEIPAVVGTKDILERVSENDLVILDAVNGEIIINPSEDEINDYSTKSIDFTQEKVLLKGLRDKQSQSSDGHHVELAGNIGSPKDLKAVLENGAEGVGLYRTEFLYMDREDFPTEEEQFEAYKSVLEGMSGKPVVIRTLDIGGDKELPYLHLPKEMNPFLGYRAIRICLKEKEIFRTQLRALLRASSYGNLKIMFPMIATVDEFVAAKTFLLEVKEELLKESQEVGTFEIGMMMEIPAAAILADQFAKHADFFSIGTNDMIQYSFAADRMNEEVSYLYQPLNPSLLRIVDMIIKAAHANGRWVGMCGEVASDKNAIPILLGLGLDEFSMSATNILSSRNLISKLSKKDMEVLSGKALQCQTEKEVLELVTKL